jgi:hypothetical protein
VLLLVLALGGCAAVPERPGPAPDAAARQLADAGRHREAADLWLKLAAQARKDTAQQYRLAAADCLVSAGDRAGARKVLGDAQSRGIPSSLRVRSDIVTARLALEENRPEIALSALAGPYTDPAARSDRWRVQMLRSEAQVRLDRPVEAARERVVAEAYSPGDADSSRNRLAIWNLLGKASARALTQGRPPPPDTFAGWLELAALQRQHSRDPAALARAMELWRTRYPRHPAELDLVPEIVDAARARGGLPSHIALLLPEDGPFAAAGRAVREGFIAAWYAQGAGTRVSVYDTSQEDLRAIIDRAVEGGADFVVGPLDKPSVARLAAAPGLPVPVLALNRQEGPAASRGGELYQFGLTPEDEAQAVAAQARADGFARAALLFPDTEWGDRVAGAFRDRWRDLGGTTVAEGRFGRQPDSFATAVASVLRSSSGRPVTAQSGDWPDVIFLAAFPAEARQLRYQIAQQQGGHLPLYATSHVYSGTPDPRQDLDLEGVNFADMPWVISPERVEPGMQRTFAQNWPELRDGYNRLFAFGVDAFRLLPHLSPTRAATTSGTLSGVTGRLALDSGNRVMREPSWAQFRNGVAVPLGSPDATPDTTP